MSRATDAGKAALERGQCDLNDLLSIERAHDVRTLRTAWYHGRCFAAKFGEKALLEMGRIQLERLCIGDLGTKLVTAVIDRLGWSKQ